MYNYFMLVGYICNDIEIREVADNKKVVNLFIAVQRDFLNADGEYSKDFFNVSCWEFLADIALDCLKKGSKVAVKGRLVSKKKIKNEKEVLVTELVAEKIITFSSNTNTNVTKVENLIEDKEDLEKTE